LPRTSGHGVLSGYSRRTSQQGGVEPNETRDRARCRASAQAAHIQDFVKHRCTRNLDGVPDAQNIAELFEDFSLTGCGVLNQLPVAIRP